MFCTFQWQHFTKKMSISKTIIILLDELTESRVWEEKKESFYYRLWLFGMFVLTYQNYKWEGSGIRAGGAPS